MKFKFLLGLFSISLLSVSGCTEIIKEELKEGKEEFGKVFSVKMEFDGYLTQRDSLVERDIELNDQLAVGFYEEEDPVVALETIQEVIPQYKELILAAKAVEIKASEIQSVHDIYLESLEMTLDSLKDFEQGFLEENEELFVSGDEKMMNAVELASKFDEALLELAAEYRIELELVE